LNTSREGASTASLGNMLHSLTTLVVKEFLTFKLNLPSFGLKPLPLVLSLHALVKIPLQLSVGSLQELEGCCTVSPLSMDKNQ